VHGKPVVKATKAPTCKDLPMQDQPIKIQQPTNSEPIKVQHSVEVQTSFIELNPPTLQQTKENLPHPGPVTHGNLTLCMLGNLSSAKMSSAEFLKLAFLRFFQRILSE
jgi:hypothetical protein